MKYSKFTKRKILSAVAFGLGCVLMQAQKTENLDSLLLKKQFTIEMDWAYPVVSSELQQLANAGLFQMGNSPGQINVTGTNNYITFKNDSIEGHLSYYGVRRMGGSYGSMDGGIILKGIPEDFKITQTKKGAQRINFNIEDAQSGTENYQISMVLRSLENASININSTARNSISYRGRVVPIITVEESGN